MYTIWYEMGLRYMYVYMPDILLILSFIEIFIKDLVKIKHIADSRKIASRYNHVPLSVSLLKSHYSPQY